MPVDEFTVHGATRPEVNDEVASSESASSDSESPDVVLVGVQVVNARGDEAPGTVKASQVAIKPAPAKALTATPAVSWWSLRNPAPRAWIDL